jgi:hypothetical protein
MKSLPSIDEGSGGLVGTVIEYDLVIWIHQRVIYLVADPWVLSSVGVAIDFDSLGRNTLIASYESVYGITVHSFRCSGDFRNSLHI